MKFSKLAQIFSEIEPISSRLQMTERLSELFTDASVNEAKAIAYLVLGQLNPEYLGTQFNLAEKTVLKVIAQLLNQSETQVAADYKKVGDLGSLVLDYVWQAAEDLSVLEVYERMQQLENISGTGSQDIKQEFLYKLLCGVDSVSAKFIIRIVLGTLRLGFSDMTVVDALSWMLVGSKELRDQIEHAYNLSADLGEIAYVAKKMGLPGIAAISIVPGIPIRPAAAERAVDAAAIIEKIGPCVVQPKLDGFRLQVHVGQIDGRRSVKFFSRNLLDMSEMFPDLISLFANLKVGSLICEGEAIVYDEQTGVFASFQQTVKRRRKHGIDQAAEELPLKLVLFDILYLNGEELLSKTMVERREILLGQFSLDIGQNVFVIETEMVQDAQALESYFLREVAAGLEGIIAKKPHAIYQPGKRNFNWIKLKRKAANQLNDSIDCVILGYYVGRGKRANFGIGAFLVGIYNQHKTHFQTVAKVGTGLTDQEWIDLKRQCDAIVVSQKPKEVECAKELEPDVWVLPELVCTIEADELTRSPLHTANKTSDHLGLALRFPRMVGQIRLDKNASGATTVDELKELYEMQFKG